MSGVGKTLLVAALCRILRQDGYRVAPFKSQNMALNSFITPDGLEIGRAQAMQAEAAGIAPSVLMNPILLKPTSDIGSQVIVNGEVRCTMSAKEYFQYKTSLIPDIQKAFEALQKTYDIVIIEGAGSPAEINLKQNDIVNMGMAAMADAPVLLVGDIDRGGVFAQLYGTILLLEEEEKKRIRGMIMNKFRGDPSILKPGIVMLEEKLGIPVTGVIPYMHLDLDDEDSLSERFCAKGSQAVIMITVIRFPRISNFTDFAPLEAVEGISVVYVHTLAQLKSPDLVILPGTKNTIEDLLWLRQSGLAAAVQKLAAEGIPVFGICGGYQMMGEMLSDPEGTEGGKPGVCLRGLGLLPIATEFCLDKVRTLTEGIFCINDGVFAPLDGCCYEGYEIHMGNTYLLTKPLFSDSNAEKRDGKPCMLPKQSKSLQGVVLGNCCGTYVHGVFDRAEACRGLIRVLAAKKGIRAEQMSMIDRKEHKEQEYDRLAEQVRAHLNMREIYQIFL